MRSRLLAPLVVALALAVGLAAPARAQDTTAVAVNSKDDSAVYRLAFQIRRTMQAVVDPGNAAVAVADCTDCRTVAVAIQVVLAMGDVDELTATNLALAYNLGCTGCDTAAFAYQLVTGTGGPVHFTADGNRRLAELRRRLRALRDTGLTDDQIAAEVDGIAGELKDVLATDMVGAGASGSPAPSDSTEPAPTASAQPAPADTATPSPAPTDTATPAPTPTETATPSPSPTATPTPSPGG